MAAISGVFGDTVIIQGLGPARFPDFMPCHSYLWDSLKDKA
jgi:hypothetical protein